jgi:uncharacterized protein
MHTDIRVKLIPRSAKNHVLGPEGEHYRVKVTAPPVQGQANKALVALLSETLGIAKRDIEITSGRSARFKTVRIHGLTEARIAQGLAAESAGQRAKRGKTANSFERSKHITSTIPPIDTD